MFTTEAKSKGKDSKSKPAKTSKTAKKAVDNSGVAKRPWYKHGFVFGILGIALLMVFVSIAVSAAIILMGMKGVMPFVVVAPMCLFDLVLAGIAFSKIFK